MYIAGDGLAYVINAYRDEGHARWEAFIKAAESSRLTWRQNPWLLTVNKLDLQTDLDTLA